MSIDSASLSVTQKYPLPVPTAQPPTPEEDIELNPTPIRAADEKLLPEPSPSAQVRILCDPSSHFVCCSNCSQSMTHGMSGVPSRGSGGTRGIRGTSTGAETHTRRRGGSTGRRRGRAAAISAGEKDQHLVQVPCMPDLSLSLPSSSSSCCLAVQSGTSNRVVLRFV